MMLTVYNLAYYPYMLINKHVYLEEGFMHERFDLVIAEFLRSVYVTAAYTQRDDELLISPLVDRMWKLLCMRYSYIGGLNVPPSIGAVRHSLHCFLEHFVPTIHPANDMYQEEARLKKQYLNLLLLGHANDAIRRRILDMINLAICYQEGLCEVKYESETPIQDPFKHAVERGHVMKHVLKIIGEMNASDSFTRFKYKLYIDYNKEG